MAIIRSLKVYAFNFTVDNPDLNTPPVWLLEMIEEQSAKNSPNNRGNSVNSSSSSTSNNRPVDRRQASSPRREARSNTIAGPVQRRNTSQSAPQVRRVVRWILSDALNLLMFFASYVTLTFHLMILTTTLTLTLSIMFCSPHPPPPLDQPLLP